jgi:peptidoglycan/LPS O-acetylase OafA/YrhL
MTVENRYSQLHILRGFSALMVVLGHAKVVFWSGGKMFIEKFPITNWKFYDYLLFLTDLFSSAAQSFVIVFFVLSGFFINLSFKKHNWNFKNFLINRFIRIFPPYFAALLFSLIVILFINYLEKPLFDLHFSRAFNQRLSNSYENLNFKSFFYALFFIPTKDYFACNFSFWSLLYEWIFYFSIAVLKQINK